MDLTRLRVFAAVARHGSVTGAAEALHYAQPSISHHLARLEAEVGTPLIQRAGRGVRLTQAGRLLALRAEEILGRVDSIQTELAAHAGLRAGRVRLAAFPSALATLVPPAAARLAVDAPELELALVEAEPPESLAALRNGDVDVALAFEHDTPATPAPAITSTVLLEEPLYVVTPLHRTWEGRRSALATYADERWIAGCERCRAHLLASCAEAGFTPTIEFETDDYVAAQALVAAGVGVTTLPGLALLASRNDDVRIDPIPGDHRRVIAVTYGTPHARPVQAFLDILMATLTPPDWPA
ncbi:LysR family transcriptional regulator [Actinobacteria bacterium YIM 96077]|uniref:LysR family transcriptional regulator n=1 Tax=Phytoactinopolyspora halophila TaxID=1981511 RepID=A0A329QSW7_9ACTN|nr:LysR family transcriptional regulator [Phytoactinopolyspora halophila]AYY14909.1 LysR family transcriptional regulator [Actinobacteria bacterium YIM 96077]RAW15367.1 LysR family transcriptional regulator [Phytoactinopolyspora halophila]